MTKYPNISYLRENGDFQIRLSGFSQLSLCFLTLAISDNYSLVRQLFNPWHLFSEKELEKAFEKENQSVSHTYGLYYLALP